MKEFLNECTNIVRNYTNRNTKEGEKLITNDDVYVVWSCKTLQNMKALLSTTRPDGKYYELTYNGDRKEIYFDAYVKEHNEVI